ncbi:MAG: hypothetical protein HY721_22200 [Planctomycetes bacterium]|nr:hypothetical protein [Planctomycetota bacterium]
MASRGALPGGLWVAVCVVFAAVLPGCLSPEVRRQAVLNEARCERFVELMGRGKTTREEERGFIGANLEAWRALRSALGLEGGRERPRAAGGLLTRVVRLAVSAVPRVWVSVPLLEPRVEVAEGECEAGEEPEARQEREARAAIEDLERLAASGGGEP